MNDIVGNAFGPAYGHPCWNVKPGVGGFLTMEFGNPTLPVHALLPTAQAEGVPRRGAVVHGEWHLWVYCCEWVVRTDGKEIGHSNLNGRGFALTPRLSNKVENCQKYLFISIYSCVLCT